jgi:hypothetical protein
MGDPYSICDAVNETTSWAMILDPWVDLRHSRVNAGLLGLGFYITVFLPDLGTDKLVAKVKATEKALDFTVATTEVEH